MSRPEELVAESAEELFEDAPCGYLTTRPDGTILRVNRTFERWTGFTRDELVQRRRLSDLLTAGGRIYHETHYAPLLQMQGSAREIALDIVRADGSRLPALVTSVVRHDADGRPRVIRTMVFDATDRRGYERELVRAREREHDIALELQRSLLTWDLPDDDRLAVDVAYRPAVRGLEVGGDWYDAFALDEPGTVAIVVGDVVGRGLEAATTMGQLRSAIRALAAVDAAPGAVLAGLERYVARHETGDMATFAYGVLDVGTRELRYVCAGHPPPAVMAPGVAPRLLMDGRGMPLGVGPPGFAPSEGREVLDPGSVVVLYTDGLIERRDRPLQAGLDLVLSALAAIESPADVAEAVMRSLTGRDGRDDDDVCVLAASLRG